MAYVPKQVYGLLLKSDMLLITDFTVAEILKNNTAVGSISLTY